MKYLEAFFTFCFISILTIAFSQSVDIQTAEKVAINFYFEQYNSFEDGISFDEISIKESFSLKQNGEDALYIFNIVPDGFVLIPSEKAIEPILGYAFKGHYNPAIIDKNYQEWMQTYVNKVGHLKQNKVKAKKELTKKWDKVLNMEVNKISKQKNTKDIDPLLTSIWDQDFPYNIYCPEDPVGPGGYSYVGSVGTAMGQIMYYWQYPNSGIGSISYYCYPYGEISVNFAETDYEWEGMMDEISQDNPKPIALLLYHCAVSVESNFGPDGSGAYSTDVDDALINYFGYDDSCQYLQRSSFTLSTWTQMLKDELDNFHPIYYSGVEPIGNGHAFVVDGYQESDDDYFHINFSWSGYMNGWYLITDAGGFTQNQNMIRNIFPGSDYPYYCQGSKTICQLSGSLEDGSGTINNYQDNADCNWLITPQCNNDSVSGIIINFSDFHTETGNDIVSIYDGPTNSYPLLGSFSGSSLPPQITSTKAEVLINFSTNESNTESGWQLNFESTLPVFCTSLQTYNSYEGEISDGSGSFKYQNNEACTWMIDPPGEDELTLYFSSFETEEDKDIVKIYDAENNQLLAEYSGIYPPGDPPPPVVSPSGEMFITFQTDIINNYSGWEANYSSDYYYPSPTNFVLSEWENQVTMNWNKPDTTNSGLELLGYNIYQNGWLLNTEPWPDTTYNDSEGEGEYEYCVSALYTEGESIQLCDNVSIPIYALVEFGLTDSITGEGLEGIMFDIGGKTYYTGFSGYTVFNFPEGTYTLSINEPGYQPLDTIVVVEYFVITFDLVLVPLIPSPENFELEFMDEIMVFCSWDEIDTTNLIYSFLGYNLYRNDTLLNSTLLAGNFYNDFTFYNGSHEYCIIAEYEVAGSNPNCAGIVIPCHGLLESNITNYYSGLGIEGIFVNVGDTSFISGPDGIASIMLPEGTFDITINEPGYEPINSSVEIMCEETTNIELVLLPLLPPPSGVDAVVTDETTVYCSWTPADTLGIGYELLGYNIYRNDTLLNTNFIVDNFYYDFTYYVADHEYCVTSVYEVAESIQVCKELILETGNLDGYVLNINTNIPIEGAMVSLGTYSITTDATGYFDLTDIFAGSYEVAASAENYFPFPPGSIIEIPAGGNETLNILLEPMYLNPPLNLQFETVGDEELLLFWDPPLSYPWEFEGYNVYRRDYGVGEFVKINEELVLNSSYYDLEFPLYSQTEYYVTSYYNAGESDSSNNVLVVISDIFEKYLGSIGIYPNPAKDKLNITLPNNIDFDFWTIALYNSVGECKTITEVKPNDENQIVLDLIDFERGIYILKLASDKIDFARKIIVK